MSLYHINKLRKEGITIIADYGFIYNNNKKDKFEDLLELEKSIPYFFESIKILIFDERYSQIPNAHFQPVMP